MNGSNPSRFSVVRVIFGNPLVYFFGIWLCSDGIVIYIVFFTGGYNHANTARLWTTLTALVTGVALDENIPEHQHWTKYGPGYMLSVETMLAKDTNKKEYLNECIDIIRGR